MSQHKEKKQRGWGEIQTADNSDDRDDSGVAGQYKNHPKVYAGFFKHANFFEKKTNINVQGVDEDEFRSNDWVYMPVMDDMKRWDEISGEPHSDA